MLVKAFTQNVTTKEKLLLLFRTQMAIYLVDLPLQIGILAIPIKMTVQLFSLP